MIKVFLWGMMGSGKSTVAKKLANRLGYSAVDTDQLIEAKTGKRINEIFEEKGEEYFRLLEEAVLDQVLDMRENLVVATGGGLPCFKSNASKMLGAGICIYLVASSDQLVSRLWQSTEKRPLLKDSRGKEALFKQLESILEERAPYYEKATLKASAMNLDLVSLTGQVRSFQNDLGL
ncbi:MAG: shikimate kinase [Flavobacteriales bacterium]